MAAISIDKSVGLGGVNRHDDVVAVQNLLNKFILAGTLGGPALIPDGKSGSKTRSAIKGFQALFLGFLAPDGRVDPGGQTLTALNGPPNQPKKGDPHDSAVQSVVSVLRGTAIGSLRFQMNGYALQPSDFKSLAELFSWRRLQVYYMSGLGSNAQYFHTNDATGGGHMVVGFPRAMTATQKAVVVHEATHAVCDGWGKMMGNVQAEALAHLAQGVYYYTLTGHHFSISNPLVARVLQVAVNIAIRMDASGKRTVTDDELSELYGAVIKLPTVPAGKVFLYDGL